MPNQNVPAQAWTPVDGDGEPPLFTGPHANFGLTRPAVRPGVSHVFVTADGDYLTNDRRPTFGQALSARSRFDVDTTQRLNDLADLMLPSAENNFYFPTAISLTWRVHDPVTVVRNGISSPTVVIEQSVVRTLREITAQIQPQQWQLAERQLHQAFGGQFALPEGITVLRFVAKVSIDPQLAQFLSHKAATQGRLQLEEMDRTAIEASLQRGEHALVVEHLVKNPGATGDVINVLLSGRNFEEQKRQEMFRLLVENKVIQDVDLERFRENLLAAQSGVSGTTALSFRGADNVLMPATQQLQPPVIPPEQYDRPATGGDGVIDWEPIETDGRDGYGTGGVR